MLESEKFAYVTYMDLIQRDATFSIKRFVKICATWIWLLNCTLLCRGRNITINRIMPETYIMKADYVIALLPLKNIGIMKMTKIIEHIVADYENLIV